MQEFVSAGPHDTATPTTDEALDAKPVPVRESARIEDIDVIRGAALFGVLMMNLVDAFRVPIVFAGDFPPAPDRLNRILQHVLDIVVAGKAYTLFSLLFGVGLGIFLERASARGPGASRLLARRLLILGAFGLAHMIFIWNGDVLFGYAVAGLIALPLIRLRPAILLTIAVAMYAVFPLVRWRYPALLPPPGPDAAQRLQAAYALYGHGSYADILASRAGEQWRYGLRYDVIAGVPLNLTNILIGAVVWRSEVVRHVDRYRRALWWMVAIGIALGAGFAIHREFGTRPATFFGRMLGRAGIHMTMTAFGLGYGAGLLLLLRRPRVRAVLLHLAPLGRMAFTNYLTESIIFSTLFYGYGFALMGKVSVAVAVVIGFAVYALQGVFSAHWLRRFRFGPFEWIWRSLTYGTFMRNSRRTLI